MPIRNTPIEPLKFDRSIEVFEQNGQFVIRGGIVTGHVANPTRRGHLENLCKSSSCIYCGASLRSAQEIIADGSDLTSQSVSGYSICDDCGNWRHYQWSTMTGSQYRLPVAYNFSNDKLVVASLFRLAEQVSRDPSTVFKMSPERFEIFVGSVMSEYFDCKVHHVGRTGDGGIDLIALRAPRPTLIQVKRRQMADAVESIETVKLMFASTVLAKESDAIVVTSARRFTRGARNFPGQISLIDRDFNMNLVDMAELLRICEVVSQNHSEHPFTLHQRKRESIDWGFDGRYGRILEDPKLFQFDSGLVALVETANGTAYAVLEMANVDEICFFFSKTAKVKLDGLKFEDARSLITGVATEQDEFSRFYDLPYRSSVQTELFEVIEVFLLKSVESDDSIIHIHDD